MDRIWKNKLDMDEEQRQKFIYGLESMKKIWSNLDVCKEVGCNYCPFRPNKGGDCNYLKSHLDTMINKLQEDYFPFCG